MGYGANSSYGYGASGGYFKSGEAPAPPFNPANVANVDFYCEPDNLGLADTDPIPQFTDESPGGNDAVQGTAGNQSVFLANQINGLGVAHLDPAGPDFYGITLAPMTAFTIACVFKRTNNGNILIGGDTANSYIYLDNTNLVQTLLNGTTDNFAGYDSSVYTHLVVVYDGADISVYRTGVLIGTEAAPGLTVDWQEIGGRNGGANPIGADIASLLFVSRALDAGELTLLNTYVGKFGL